MEKNSKQLHQYQREFKVVNYLHTYSTLYSMS